VFAGLAPTALLWPGALMLTPMTTDSATALFPQGALYFDNDDLSTARGAADGLGRGAGAQARLRNRPCSTGPTELRPLHRVQLARDRVTGPTGATGASGGLGSAAPLVHSATGGPGATGAAVPRRR